MMVDTVEKKILGELQRDGRITNVDLAQAIGLSESPTFRRVRQLEADGTVAGYVAVLDARRLGLTVAAFVQVSMDKQPDSDQDEFHRRVQAEPHIVECHAMSGSHDFLMKVVAKDIDHFAELCMNDILKYPGVHHIESAFSLKEIKNTHALPI